MAEETGIPKSSVHRYVEVSRRRDRPTAIAHGESISSIIEEDVPSVRTKKARASDFGPTDAEYAIKLHRMAESDNPNEADVAARKLDQFASDHGMTGEEMTLLRPLRRPK